MPDSDYMWTMQDFYRLVQVLQYENPDWRKGQAMFNALDRLDPELANMIRSTPEDPFYRDERIPTFELLLWGQPKGWEPIERS